MASASPTTDCAPGTSSAAANGTAGAATLLSGDTPSSINDIAAFVNLLLPFTAFLGLPDWLKLAILGTVLETARRYLSSWWTTIQESVYIDLYFDHNDSAYDWMMSWGAQQPAFRRARALEVTTRSSNENVGYDVPGQDVKQEDGTNKKGNGRRLQYIPSASVTYSGWHKYHWIQFTRTRNEGQWGNHDNKLHVRILTRSRDFVNDLLCEAKRQFEKSQEDEISVYVNDSCDSWRHVATRPKRPMRSIILDSGIKDLLLEDARDFMDSKTWYAQRGIPFRRGYLLYGAPGSGKTSLIQAIAGELDLDIYIVSLSKGGLDDTSLAQIISELPERCIALMEDIDAAFLSGLSRTQDGILAAGAGASDAGSDDGKPGEKERDGAGSGQAGPASMPVSRVTLSGLLNALDGIGAQEGRVLFATTNRYQALDAALIRPGRFDLHVEFRRASTAQAQMLFEAFYMPDEEEAEKAAARAASDGKVTEIQEDEKDKDLIDLDADEATPLLEKSTLDASADDTSSTVVVPPTPSDSRPASPTPSVAASAASTTPNYIGLSHKARAPALSRKTYQALAGRFATALPAEAFSMAELQGYLMGYKIRPREAAADVTAWVERELKERERKQKA